MKLLIQLTCFRILSGVHKSLTTQVVIDFLKGESHFISQLYQFLLKRSLPDKYRTMLVQYLQTTLVALLNISEKTLKSADVEVKGD